MQKKKWRRLVVANRIPTKNRKIVKRRSEGLCEICNRFGSSIHHIIFRRKKIHRPETLIMLCERHHRMAHNTQMKKQLLAGLQKLYKWQGNDEAEIRDLMGGRLYILESDLMKVIELHFKRLYKANNQL